MGETQLDMFDWISDETAKEKDKSLPASVMGSTCVEPIVRPLAHISPKFKEEALDFKLRKRTPDRSSLLRTIQEITPLSPEGRRRAVAACGYTGSSKIDVHLATLNGRAKAGVTKVYRCKNGNLCPVCAPAVAAARASGYRSVATGVQRKGGTMLLVTLTTRHSLGDGLASAMTALKEASTAARAGGQWHRNIRSKLQAVGTLVDHHIRWSPSAGWHYHQHLSMACLTKNEHDLREGAAAFIARYRAELKKRNFDADAEQWFDLADCEPDSTYSYPADHHREDDPFDHNGELDRESLSPFQIAEMAATGDVRMVRLWQEYARAVHGLRSAVVTKAMADALDIEASTEEGPIFDASTKLGTLSSAVWSSLLDQGLRGTFLTKLEMGGRSTWPAVHSWAHGVLPWINPPKDDADAACRQATITSFVDWQHVLDSTDDPDCKQYIREEIGRAKNRIGLRYAPAVAVEIAERAQLLYRDKCPDRGKLDELQDHVACWVDKAVRRRRPGTTRLCPCATARPSPQRSYMGRVMIK